MTRLLLLIVLAFSLTDSIIAQTLTESNLPIIVIDSNGDEINGDDKVEATMKVYYNENGNTNSISDEPTDYDGKIDVKLRGQTSLFLFDKKSYKIETIDDDGKDSTVNLLGMPKESDWVLHGPYSDKSLMRNALLYTMADEILAYAPRVQLVEIIVNDDYKGVYLFTEQIKRDDSRVDIARLRDEDIDGIEVTGGYLLKFDKAESEEIGWTSPYSISEDQPTHFVHVYPKWDEIQPEQATYIQNWITNFENVLDSDDFADPEEGYRKYISVESFIDHMLLNELSRNVDGYRLSTYMYKTKDQEDEPGQLYMGPVWDYNIAFGNAEYCRGWDPGGWAYNFNEDCGDDYWQIHFWWERLMEDPVFVERTRDKWMKLRNGKFSDSNVYGWIDDFEAQLEDAQERNFQRWPVLGEYVWPNKFVGETYEEEMAYMREWIMERLEWMDQALDIELSVDQEIEGKKLQLRPNPASDILVINSDNVSVGMAFEILNLNGEKMMVGQLKSDKKVIISELSAGTYILRMIDEEGSLVEKFIKQ